MVLAFCEPSRVHGNEILGGNTLSTAAFSAAGGHTFCSAVRVKKVDQRCPSRSLQDVRVPAGPACAAGGLQGWNTSPDGQKSQCWLPGSLLDPCCQQRTSAGVVPQEGCRSPEAWEAPAV